MDRLFHPSDGTDNDESNRTAKVITRTGSVSLSSNPILSSTSSESSQDDNISPAQLNLPRSSPPVDHCTPSSTVGETTDRPYSWGPTNRGHSSHPYACHFNGQRQFSFGGSNSECIGYQHSQKQPYVDISDMTTRIVDTSPVIRWITDGREEQICDFKNQPFVHALIHEIWRHITTYDKTWDDVRYRWVNQCNRTIDLMPYLRWYCWEPFDQGVYENALSDIQINNLMNVLSKMQVDRDLNNRRCDEESGLKYVIDQWPSQLATRQEIKVLWRKLREAWGLVAPDSMMKERNDLEGEISWDRRRAALESYRYFRNFGSGIRPCKVNLDPWMLSTFGYIKVGYRPDPPTMIPRSTEGTGFSGKARYSCIESRLHDIVDHLFGVDEKRKPIEALNLVDAHYSHLIESQSTQTIVVIGDKDCGKSTLVRHLCGDSYPSISRTERYNNTTMSHTCSAFRVYFCDKCSDLKNTEKDIIGFTGAFPHESNIDEKYYGDDGRSRVPCPNCGDPQTKLLRHFGVIDSPPPACFKGPISSCKASVAGITKHAVENCDICIYCLRLDIHHFRGFDPVRWETVVSMMETVGTKNVVFVVLAVDLAPPDVVEHFLSIIKNELCNSSFENCSLIPISLRRFPGNKNKYGLNIDVLLETLVTSFPKPMRFPLAPPKLTVFRSLNTSRSGEIRNVEDLERIHGGVLICLLTDGCLIAGEDIEITPGIIHDPYQVGEPFSLKLWTSTPLKTRVLSIQCCGRPLSVALPGALIGLGTTLDPSITSHGLLAGNQVQVFTRGTDVLNSCNKIGENLKFLHVRFNPFPNVKPHCKDVVTFTQITVSFNLFKTVKGYGSKGMQREEENDPAEERGGGLQHNDLNYRTNVLLMINCFSTKVLIIQIRMADYNEVHALRQRPDATSNRQGLFKAELQTPCTASLLDQVIIFRRVHKSWRPCGHGYIVSGLALSDRDGSFDPVLV
eukprot:GHVH01000859.1.p1 GENE.GHVH01000859.1~~GHVH01000859.1.p1  ORF type:complete len:961 (-),score=100.00 GHVH01000859.1:82-2964(-)